MSSKDSFCSECGIELHPFEQTTNMGMEDGKCVGCSLKTVRNRLFKKNE